MHFWCSLEMCRVKLNEILKSIFVEIPLCSNWIQHCFPIEVNFIINHAWGRFNWFSCQLFIWHTFLITTEIKMYKYVEWSIVSEIKLRLYTKQPTRNNFALNKMIGFMIIIRRVIVFATAFSFQAINFSWKKYQKNNS